MAVRTKELKVRMSDDEFVVLNEKVKKYEASLECVGEINEDYKLP